MSGITGYNTQKKVTSLISGYTAKQTQDTSQFVTVSRTSNDKVLEDIKTVGSFRIGAILATEAGTTNRIIKCTAHGGSVGDFIRFELATGNPFYEVGILSVPDANTIIIDGELPVVPTLSDDFYILRHATQRLDDSGAQIVVATQGPTQFVLNGVDTEVSEDTATPANSNPFPVAYLNTAGVRTNLSTETTQVANGVLIGAVNETAPASDTASSGLNGRLQRVAQRITSMIALLPLSLGTKAAIDSFATTWSTEDEALIGSLTETAPASDTASSGLNGRLQRVAQRITSMIALLPASLGTKAAAASFATTWSTEDEALIGALTETAPATDTASSGLNGRLQRVAQRITSLIALVPASLGQKTMANSFAVTMASDQTGVATKSPVNTNGSVTNQTLTATTASTLSVPANAVGFILEAPSANTDFIRYAIGSTASTTVGLVLEPGRDTGFIPCAANVSVCATVSGTNKADIQWVLSV